MWSGTSLWFWFAIPWCPLEGFKYWSGIIQYKFQNDHSYCIVEDGSEGIGDKQVKDDSEQTKLVRLMRSRWITGASKKYSLREFVIGWMWGLGNACNWICCMDN